MGKDTRLTIGYIRKSKVVKGRATVSYEVQQQAIEPLAAAHGDNDIVYMSDWNRSGTDEKLGRRLQWAELLRLVENDQVRAIYGYDISRLTRGMATYMKLCEVARKHGVSVRLAVGGELSLDDPEDQLRWDIIVSVAQYEARKARQRAAGLLAFRRSRGDKLGSRFWGSRDDEDINDLITAFQQAGSLNAAAKLLNAKGIRTRNTTEERKGEWHPSVLREILNRVQPGLVPPTVKGRKPYGPYPFYALLKCPCGLTMYGRRTRYRSASGEIITYDARYSCHRSQRVADHNATRKEVTEQEIATFLKQELALLTVPEEVRLASDAKEQIAVLERRRERANDLYFADQKPKDWWTTELAAVKTGIEELSWVSRTVEIPTVDWDGEVTGLNQALRAIFDYVQLDEGLHPAQAVWRNERLRGSAASAA